MSALVRIALGAIVALAAGAGVMEPGPADGPSTAAAARPNIVVILTDDQRADGADRMPIVHARLAAHGTTFANAFVSNPLCCPSRTTLLTGRYSHSTSVWSNRPPFGGWPAFRRGAERRTIAVALRRAGYRTAFIGKYLNYYDGSVVPPGWSDWRAFAGGWGYYGYTLNVNGRLASFGRRATDYSTDVLARMAAGFVRRSKAPFFLVYAPAAPHQPAIPAPRHATSFPRLAPYRSGAWLESDISDKPAYVRRLWQPRDTRAGWFRLRQYRSLLAVDDGVGRILDALRRNGRLRDTLVIFTSDNGVEGGDHGFSTARKSVPYEGSLRVPLVVRWDRLGEVPAANRRLVTNLDIAATVADAAHVRYPTEGRTLLPLLRGGATAWRTKFLVENLRGETAQAHIPTYCGLRTEHEQYSLYETGEEELYDLDSDPDELENRAGDRAFAATRAHLLDGLRDACFPLPPAYHPRALCTLRGTAHADRLQGGRGRDYACPGTGADVVATGAGGDTVYAGAPTIDTAFRTTFRPAGWGHPGSRIDTGAGNDRVLARNGRRDSVRCGPGLDFVQADRFDAVARDCEHVARPS